jgi:hypothetical protein
MTVMLERWNDDRMDGLAAKVDGIGEELREQRREMKAGFERMDERFERLHRGLMNAAIALTSSVIVGFATVLATQL